MSEVAAPVSCVHCGKTFYGPRMGVSMIRDRNQLQAMAKFFHDLRQHLAYAHAKEAGGIMAAEAEFSTMMVLSRFRSNDPQLQKKVDMSRWNVHQNTLAVKISDQEIQASVEAILPELVSLADMKDTAGISQRLSGLLRFMRDQLQEPGKYDLNSVLMESSGVPVAVPKNPASV